MSARGPVLIMAGGTGGHIFPGLAVAEVLRERGVSVAWLGARGGMEARLVPAHDIPLHLVSVSGLRGKGWAARLKAPWMLLRALWQAWRLLRQLRPCSVLSLGGFVAGPGGIAAWLQRRPLLVHEQNRVAGLTNRWLARLARRVLTGFEDSLTGRRGQQWVGNPVRAAIANLAPPAQRFDGREGPLRLLVLGGSLGAQRINQSLPQALATLDASRRPLIRHQAGRAHLEATRTAYAKAGVDARVDAFIDDMADAYAWADLCLCRAGALTVAELAAAGLGALLVPYPHAVDDHQTRNAEALSEVGAARILQQRDMTPATLADALRPLLADRAGLLAMAEAARALARPRAAARIADCCIQEAA